MVFNDVIDKDNIDLLNVKVSMSIDNLSVLDDVSFFLL